MPASLPTITIVVPSLNHGAFIETALGSILDQRYPLLEIVVADGGSTDATADILSRYAGRLTAWWSKPDRGPAAALNEGFSAAGGDVLGVLNADDFLLPGSLEAIGRYFRDHDDVDVVSGHGYFATPDGALGIEAYSDAFDRARFRYGACVLMQPATFFRRRVFDHAGGFRQSGRVCWDMELWADLSDAGARFATIDAYLAAFRLHPQSLTTRPEMQSRRRHDARDVAAQFGGASERFGDRARRLAYRAAKFARHPRHTLRQRWFFRATIGRWSL